MFSSEQCSELLLQLVAFEKLKKIYKYRFVENSVSSEFEESLTS